MGKTCQIGSCEEPAVTAIATSAPKGKGMVHKFWQFEEDAPPSAIRYCQRHAEEMLIAFLGM